jgi:Family of unknown function (DUF5677)
MTFQSDGYLERSEEARIATIRQRHARWFAFAEKLNRFAMPLVLREVPRVIEEVYVATLYARAVSMFQGVARLAERGMAAESGTLVRACAETAIALGCVRRDKTFPDQLDEDHDKHRIALGNDLLGIPEGDPNLPPAERVKLRHFIDGLAAKYQHPHPLRISWATAAITAGMVDLYRTVYRETSGHSAHVSLPALERHVGADASGSITGIRFHPELEGVANTLSQAIAALIHATEARLLGLGDTAADAELRGLALEWSSLVERQAASNSTG